MWDPPFETGTEIYVGTIELSQGTAGYLLHAVTRLKLERYQLAVYAGNVSKAEEEMIHSRLPALDRAIWTLEGRDIEGVNKASGPAN